MVCRRSFKLILLVTALALGGTIYLSLKGKEYNYKSIDCQNVPAYGDDGHVRNTQAPTKKWTYKAQKEPTQQSNTGIESEERLKRLRKTMLESCERLDLNKTLTGEDIYSRNPYLAKSLFYSDKWKLLFCLIPKCATRSQATFIASVEGLLSNQPGGAQGSAYNLIENLSPRRSNLAKNGKRIEEYTKIVIAREPFSRLLSAFRDKIENGGRGENYEKTNRNIISKYGNNTSPRDVTFEQFVSYLTMSQWDVQTDPHWNYYLRLCAPCEMNYDYVLQLDTVDEDMKYLAEKLGIKNFSFPPSFNSFTDFEKMTKYYSKVSPQLVNDLYHRYKTDYEVFGFPPPPQF